MDAHADITRSVPVMHCDICLLQPDSLPSRLTSPHQSYDTLTDLINKLHMSAAVAQEPTDKLHGDRMAAITDPAGNTWWLAKPLAKTA